MKRTELDATVARGDLRVVPAVRGCIYLIPAASVPDVLALNADAWRTQTTKELAKLGKKLDVVDKLAPSLLEALAAGPLDTHALRKQVTVVGFGDAGKKVGLSSPLPLALRMLELDGRVERTLQDGKLDSERYLWKRASATPSIRTDDLSGNLARVLQAFLSFASPCTLQQIAAWTGRSQKELRPIVSDLASAITVGADGEWWAVEDDLQPHPSPKGMSMLAFEDNYLVNHRLGFVSDAKHHDLSLDVWGTKKPERIGEADHVLGRTILIDGLIAGLWEVDPKANDAVTYLFDKQPKTVASKVGELARETTRFLLDEVGDARVFSLDTMDEVQKRADRIRELAR